MNLVCDGLDKLQGDTEIGQGYLLPTLYVMTTKLEKLLDRDYDADGNPLPPKLTVCEPLVHALRSAIKTRFPEINSSSKDAQLAAVVNSWFKLDWLDDQAEKIRMIALLKERVAALHALEQQIAANAQASTSAASESGSGSATTTSISTTADDEDFFYVLRAKRQAQHTQSPDDPRQEVDTFFRDGAAARRYRYPEGVSVHKETVCDSEHWATVECIS